MKVKLSTDKCKVLQLWKNNETHRVGDNWVGNSVAEKDREKGEDWWITDTT